MRMRHIAICGMYGLPCFLHIVSQTSKFSIQKKLLNKKNVYFYFLYNFCLKNFSF